MRITDTSDLWWKSAVVYCLDVETFYDANGDGIGDLEGLAKRIDYVADLGINCLWLMPFYPSPDRDDGYDIMDYYGVDERLGNHGQIAELIHIAHSRGIKVIADLVVNHTSDQHPWFKASRREKDPAKNPFRKYYIWRADEPGDTSDEVVFPDKEDSIWELDPKTGEYYLHHFYAHQPDLNLDHPPVVEELLRTIGFWLQLGFDGFRVDGVPFLEQTPDNADPEHTVDPHRFMKSLRDFMSWRNGQAMMLGEVNMKRADKLKFFGGKAADEMQMQFDFITMQAIYLAMARADARPIISALNTRPEIHRSCQWANFLRNHDELTLDKLTDAQRQEVFDAFGPEKEMQVYDRGLKRRLPPMLGGDPRRVKMAYSLMFSLPGTPTLYYGEEIGMGEDLAGEGRMSVRAPMQWSNDRNGGFSTARPSRLVQRVVPDAYAPEHVNVLNQQFDPDSLLSWIRRLIAIRHSCPEIGWGALSVLEHDAGKAILAHRLDLETSSIIAVHNLAPEPATVTVPLDGPFDEPHITDLLSQDHAELPEGNSLTVNLDGYGVRWLRLRPAAHLAIP